MKLNEYEVWREDRAYYPGIGTPTGLYYTVLALGGEAGELQNVLKKCLRDRGGEIGDIDKERMLLELGDVLWYCSAVAEELGVDLNKVMEKNVQKLINRGLLKDG